MNFKTELKAMRERMFTPELLEEIVAACQLEPEEYELLREPLEARDTLLSVLDGKQRTALLEAERLYAENNAYALRFAFPQGVYAGFEQFFAREGAENPFDAYVVHQILTTPNMGRHIDYFERKNQINDCFAKAERELDVDTMGHVIDLYCAWDHRLYGVLRHGFYLGFRFAVSVIDSAAPFGSKGKMIGKILQTEHALGFLQTLEEQEGDVHSRRRLMDGAGAAAGEAKSGVPKEQLQEGAPVQDDKA